MGDLSKNFSRIEFACRCGCGFDTVDYELLSVLQLVRDYFNQPVTVTSGCRCRKYNRSIYGGPESQHQYGKAADFMVGNIDCGLVLSYLDLHVPNKYGLGLYPAWVHLDVRREKARW